MYYCYIHGFASGPSSKKGLYLFSFFQNKYKLHLYCPNFNQPSFTQLTYTSMLNTMDRVHTNVDKNRDSKVIGGSGKWCLIGSSMGGYVAAIWASLNPEKVHKLLLLCPGFDLPARWPKLIGDEEFQKWEKTGFKEFKNEGIMQAVHFGIVKDASENHPPYPEVKPNYEVLIIHGKNDEVVPIESSRKFAEDNKSNVKLIEVDDDHELLKSLPLIEHTCEQFFQLTQQISHL